MFAVIQQWLEQQNDLTIFVIRVVVTILCILIINAAIKSVLKFLAKKTNRTKIPWDHMLVKAASLPLRVYVWVIGANYLLITLLTDMQHWLDWPKPSPIFERTFSAITILAVLWFTLRFLGRAEQHFIRSISRKKESKLDSNSVRVISRIMMIFIGIVATITVLGVYKVPLAGLLTFSGVGGAAIAFSSKDILANFAGGFLIYFNRHFAVGDWIYSPDKNIEGTVEYIGWRLTCIRSFDKRPIYVPNALFNNIVVVNASRMTNRRINKNFGVRYDDAQKLHKIIPAVEAMLNEHPDIDHDLLTMAYLTDFSGSSIGFSIYTFTKTTVWKDYQHIQNDVMLRVEKIIIDHGAECAFPTTTLHVPEAIMVEMGAKS